MSKFESDRKSTNLWVVIYLKSSLNLNESEINISNYCDLVSCKNTSPTDDKCNKSSIKSVLITAVCQYCVCWSLDWLIDLQKRTRSSALSINWVKISLNPEKNIIKFRLGTVIGTPYMTEPKINLFSWINIWRI